MAEPAPADAQTALDERRQQQCAQRWISELGLSEKAQRRWLERGKKITKLYKRENSVDEARRRFCMLWSNTETIKPAVMARPPEPVVTRRFKDADPVARLASEVLERCLSSSAELQDLDGRLKSCRDDFVLVGRGQSWERYVPTKGPMVTPEIDLQPVTNGEQDEETEAYEDDDGNRYARADVRMRENGSAFTYGEPYQPVVFEESLTDYVNWEDFGHSPARTWDEVWYVWRRVYLTREQLKERFGEQLGKLVPLDWGPIQQGLRDDTAALANKAAVYEIWDKRERKVIWISKSWNSRPLDERDDLLKLQGFFPCPKPLLATTANDSAIPVPDYVFYQDQAEEIDRLTDRIQQLQEAIKVRGFYAADQKTNLNNLFTATNNILIPVPDWIRIKEGGGVSGNIEWFPVQQVVSACNALIEQRQQLMNDVYQVTGIGDIMRGMNDPRATATAEKIKGAWGTLRVRTKQVEMMRFARDCLRLKGEVIAEHFGVETLKAMSGVKIPTAQEKAQAQAQVEQMMAQAQAQAQRAALVAQAQPQGQPGQMGHNGGPPMTPPPEIPEELQKVLASPTWEDVIGLLRDNAARNFRIDIETDSTIEPDDEEQKAQAIELVGAIGNFVAQWGPSVQANPALAPLAAGVLKFAIRRFRAGRELEDVVESTMDKLMSGTGQPQAQAPSAPPPDTTPIQVAQINLQREQIKQQGETQRAGIDYEIQSGDQRIAAQDNQLKLIVGGRDPEPQVTA